MSYFKSLCKNGNGLIRSALLVVAGGAIVFYQIAQHL